MICEYGCGKEAKFKLKNGKSCCSKATSGCDAIKLKNSERVKENYKSGTRKTRIYKELSQESKDKMNWAKGKTFTTNDIVFIENSKHSTEFVKKRILKDSLLHYECSKCGIDEWQGETIVLELDHINGSNQDNRLENLRLLCPNCHSQTETFRGRNKNTGIKKVSDEEMLTSYMKHGTIRQALLGLNLAAKGGNYERMKKIIERSIVSIK